MHNENNIVNVYNRDRGIFGAASVLLIWVMLFPITSGIWLCGCGSSDSELVLIDDIQKAKMEVETEAETEPELEIGTEIEVETIVNDISAEVSPAAEPYKVYIYVCGAVTSPDVYELTDDKHVVDGIKAAGGFTETADRDAINLAERVTDGMKIYVPIVGEEIDPNSLISGGNPATGEGNGGNASTREANAATGNVVLVNINTATKEQLMTLPGIGEGKAAKIIDYRENNGPFSQNSDIMNVNGIKDGAYSKIEDLICVR